MDSNKLPLPLADQILSPARSKVLSSFVLWIGLSVFLLSLLLLTNSLNGPVLFSPFLQSFYSNRTSFDNSNAKQVFLNNAHFGNLSVDSENGEVSGVQDGKDRNFSDFSSVNGNATVFERTHLGNLSFDSDNNGNQDVKDGSFSDFNGGNGNASGVKGAHFSNLSVDGENYVNENGGNGQVILGNLSITIDAYLDSNRNIEGKSVEISSSVNNVTLDVDNVVKGNGEEEKLDSSFENCDIFDGRWVRDDSKPYYPAGSCPYIDRDFNCHLNRRPDDGYVKWKWQPNGCNIPSLNATDFLERLRGQSLVFVGDSLNRNMWESLVCILRQSVRNKKRVFEISGKTEFKKKGFYAFRFEDYNCTVDFVGSPFLVRESSFNTKNGTIETLRLDLMDQNADLYRDADIIVFNTGHWWTHEKTSKGEDYYQEGNYIHPRLKVMEAYKRALLTWARWVDKNIDFDRTQVFFRGYSVTHFKGGQWNSGGQCHKETEPIFNSAHIRKYPSKMRVFEHVLQDMKSSVVYLNISRLTDYRKDGHPSIYRMQYNTTEELVAAERSQDCSHWCLPGVPDTWNELLYVSLLKAGRGSWRLES